MTVTIAVAIVVGIVLSVALVVAATSPRILSSRAHRTVVVTLKTGRSFRGIITEADRQAIVLKATEALGGDHPVNVDGELIVLRPDVDYIQVP